MPWPFKLLMALNVLYCVMASAVPSLPAWRMFADVERMDYELRNGRGEFVPLREYTPRGFYILDRGALRSVAGFVCRKRAGEGPFTLTERVSGYTGVAKEGDCEFPAR